MRTAYVGLIALSLAACASTPSTGPNHNASWTDYRSEIARERDRGELTPMQAEDRIEAKYREMYGRDPAMEGVFAYRRELYSQAEAGNIPTPEAKALATARIDDVIARREAEADFHEWMQQRFPSDPSD